ncbi:YraN family protein [Achromobacter deleyi]|uniref:YraN family protein n=1 Tax=Achromobacter deleyi TaxID=1353891 RepID=UPI0014920B60|nr:YraN family protein [Achromobacter deleyi]QVQ25742.1 YraN family protein [Achromobacter deleyi]UIP21282.1 YraN family protein [Achromobacter deleyi]
MDDTLRLACELALAARRRAAKRRRRAGRAPGADRPPPRRSPTQRRGDQHEAAALRLLQAQGLTLLARNLWCRAGEIDLAMRDGDTLVFVEVRARARTRYGGAAASIGREKQARLARAAAHWLPELARRHWRGTTPAARFDAVVFDAGQPQWLRGAFWLP